MKVLCPIDFSEASEWGMEYAANLTKALSGRLTLFHVHPTIWPEAVQLEDEMTRSMENISGQLQVFQQTVKKEFGIACEEEMEQTTDTVEMSIAAKARNFDLIVLGTDGADNLYQHLFGSNTFHVIEETKCPVIIVPKGCAYRPIRKIIYAYDPDTNPIFQVEQLLALTAPMKAEIKVVHILKAKRSPETDRRMEMMREAVRAREKNRISWSFDYQYSDDVASAIDQYIEKQNMDMLAVNSHHRSVLEKLFDENVIKQLTRIADYPVLVFWH